jgi:hypothetical protein
VGTGLVSAYTFAFKVFRPEDVKVVRSASSDANAQDETLKLGTDYTVKLNANQDEKAGGTVTLVSPLAEGLRLSILSAITPDQQMVLTNHDGLLPTTLNDSADKAIALIQELQELLGRGITVPATSAMSPAELLNELVSAAKDARLSAEEAQRFAEICEEIKQNIFIYSWDIPHVVDTLEDVEKYPFDGYFWVKGYGNPGNAGEDIGNRLVNGKTLLDWLKDPVNVSVFGAKGDGVTDDYKAIQAAVDYAKRKGGWRVYIPSTGHAYVISKSIIVGQGVTVFGSANGSRAFAQSMEDAAAHTTTIMPTGSGSAFILAEDGAGIHDVRFLHNQPEPVEGWTPKQYGFCIEGQANYHRIERIDIVNASHGIWLSHIPTGATGTQIVIDDCRIGAFGVGLQHDAIKDTLSVTRINFAPNWRGDNQYVKQYRHDHTIGWRIGHGSGTYANGIEFYRLKTAMTFRSISNNVGRVTSARCGRFDNIMFNLVNVCAALESSDVITDVDFGTVYAQTSDDWGLPLGTSASFQFESDGVHMSFARLFVNYCGGSVMRIGGGSGGRVSIADLYVGSYSDNGENQPAFYVAKGAELKIGTYRIVKRLSKAGKYFTGEGSEAVTTGCWRTKSFFPVFNAVSVTTNGATQTITTDDPAKPNHDGTHQVLLNANINVTTPISGASVQVSYGGVTVVIDASSSGWKTANSGWTDIPESNRNTQAGRLSVVAPSGVKFNTGSCYAQWR